MWQPWASAIAVGAKTIETRSWATSYRGPLLIHAGQKDSGLMLRKMTRPGSPADQLWYAGMAALRAMGLPTDHNSCTQLAARTCGALIAVAELVACAPITAGTIGALACVPEKDIVALTDQELALGDFSPGRYGWILANVRALPEPIPYRGRQGLFDVPDSVLADSGLRTPDLFGRSA